VVTGLGIVAWHRTRRPRALEFAPNLRAALAETLLHRDPGAAVSQEQLLDAALRSLTLDDLTSLLGVESGTRLCAALPQPAHPPATSPQTGPTATADLELPVRRLLSDAIAEAGHSGSARVTSAYLLLAALAADLWWLDAESPIRQALAPHLGPALAGVRRRLSARQGTEARAGTA
jgi:hypothetical protein